MLQSDDTDATVIKDLKLLLSNNIDKRFPVTPLSICAFLLDPTQLKIDIDRYLNQHRLSKQSLLFDMIKQFKISHAPKSSVDQRDSTSTVPTTSDISVIGSYDVQPNQSASSQHYSSITLKKIRNNLIQKHTPASTANRDPVTDEIKNYLQLDVSCDDVLQFWGSTGKEFPYLRQLAQVILAIPVTSTPSEQVFSTTGLMINAKRTMLNPENVGKIQVVHDNYHLFKET